MLIATLLCPRKLELCGHITDVLALSGLSPDRILDLIKGRASGAAPDQLLAAAVTALHEQAERIAELEAKVGGLTHRNDWLEDEIANLEDVLAAMRPETAHGANENIRTVTATLPPRIMVHGQEGVGKTTLGSQFPKPVFLQDRRRHAERIDAGKLGLETYPQVHAALAALATEPHDFQTVVVDAVDELEGMIWADVCTTRGWPSMGNPVTAKAMSRPIPGGVTSSQASILRREAA